MNDKDAQKVPAPLGPVERGVRPACWEFAMDFLGDPEAPIVDAYVGSLEAEVARLRAAALEVIEFNRQHAHDQYGDADKCETWACVRTLRSALGHNAIYAVAYPGAATHKTTSSARQSSAGSYHKNSEKDNMPDKQQPEALRLAELLELAPEDGIEPQTAEDAAAGLRRLHSENETLRVERERNLNSIRVNNEIINKQRDENETLQAGYAAARLEIESLQARVKTMAEEHADELMVAHMDGRMRAEQAIPGVQWQCGPQANGFTAPKADSQPAGADRHGLPPLPDPDLRDVGTNPEDIKNFLRGYATEYAKVALAARAPAYSVLEDAAQVEIDLFNDLNRIYGNTLTAYAKEMCRLGYRKTNAARKQGANHD